MKLLYRTPLFLFSFLWLLSCQEKKYTPPVISTKTSVSISSEKISSRNGKLLAATEPRNMPSHRKIISLSPQKLLTQLENTAQKFTVHASKDTSLKCAQGTIIEIKAHSFLLDGSEYSGPVSLFVKECYSAEDMLFANLTTTSDHRLLESGGMVQLEAFAKKKSLTLLKSKPITLKMPTEAPKEYMQLFYGKESKIGPMDWIQANATKPQFALTSKKKKNNPGNFRPGNYVVVENGIGTVTTTVCILKDGKEKELSSTSYANRSLFQFGKDSSSVHFEMDTHGIIKNTFIEDSILNKRYQIKVYKLESMNADGMVYYAYTPGNLRFMDCALLFQTSSKGKEFIPSFIVPRLDYSAIKNSIHKNEKAHVIVRNYYSFISNGSGQNRLKEIKEKLDSAGNNLESISSNDLEYYVFTINQLGWINCDRFYNVPASQKITFTVGNAEGTDLKLVFSNIRSILTGTKSGDKIIFKNIPKNQPITLVGIRIVDKTAELAILKTTTQNISADKLTFLPVTVEELKEKIKTEL